MFTDSNGYQDRRGIRFDDYASHLPSSVANWPQPKRQTVDTDKAQSRFHFEFRGKPCWLCNERPRASNGQHQLHHLFAGSSGRAHERELFTYLCRDCHEQVGPDNLGRLLWAKWNWDQKYTDWVFLALRRGRFLPELEIVN